MSTDNGKTKKTVRVVIFIYSITLLIGCDRNHGIRNAAEALKSNDPQVRIQAASALSRSKDSVSVQLLIDALKDSDTGVRAAAAEALGIRRAEVAVVPLIAALQDRGMWVRVRAAEALGEIGSRAAVKPLVELMERVLKTPKGSPSSWSAGQDANAAAFALKKITGKDFRFDVARWNAWLRETKPSVEGSGRNVP